MFCQIVQSIFEELKIDSAFNKIKDIIDVDSKRLNLLNIYLR